MKKILITGICFLLLSNAYSQNSNTQAAGSPTMTIAEANRLNGVAQPTINGKPYSQYKAEQDALKQQQSAGQNVARRNGNNDGATTAAVAKPKPDLSAQGSSSVEPPITDTKPAADIVSGNTKEEKQAKWELPAALKGSSMDRSAKPVVAPAPTVADTPAQNSSNTVSVNAAPAQTTPVRTAAEIEKAKQNEESKVQPAKTDEVKNGAVQPAVELKVSTANTDVKGVLPPNKQQN